MIKESECYLFFFFIFAVPSCSSVSRWSDDPDQPPPQLQFQKERKVFLLQSGFYNKIAHETNIYSRRNPSRCSSQSHMKDWYDVNGDEIKKFFGMSIIMGILHIHTYF